VGDDKGVWVWVSVLGVRERLPVRHDYLSNGESDHNVSLPSDGQPSAVCFWDGKGSACNIQCTSVETGERYSVDPITEKNTCPSCRCTCSDAFEVNMYLYHPFYEMLDLTPCYFNTQATSYQDIAIAKALESDKGGRCDCGEEGIRQKITRFYLEYSGQVWCYGVLFLCEHRRWMQRRSSSYKRRPNTAG